jgi:hypothetical protein
MSKSHDFRENPNKDDFYDVPPYISRETGQKPSLFRFECSAMFTEKALKYPKITECSFMTFVWYLNTLTFQEEPA